MSLNRETAHRSLQRLCATLEASYPGRYWIWLGTLLGAVRDGDFIGHDGDIDLAMHARDIDVRLVTTLEAAGFRLRCVYDDPGGDGYLMIKLIDGDVKIDIFACREEGGRLWHSMTRGYPQVRYWFQPFAVVPHRFRGIAVNVPEPAERVLAEIYGPGWRTPTRRWHYAYSAHNVTVRGNAPQKAWFWMKNGVWQVKARLKPLLHR